jgi:hypothetical protein
MVSHLVSRAPVGIQPLSNPKSGDLESYVEWFEDILDPEEGKMETTDIPIEPSESQVATWRVVYRKGVPIPIGVTAAWFPFGDQPRNFKMEGLIGCTGIIAAVSSSFAVSEASVDICPVIKGPVWRTLVGRLWRPKLLQLLWKNLHQQAWQEN